ncbi:leucyl aminopeptidase [Thiohalophilus sp.]|uniref:leucyl aminopeptidase n=1 Tax=Thiohalophilus sp. TaxID=3028392 RepID=UPI002ACEBDD3|nr:leucyl aminopeptidase [Thiohalophilus sp.]MDZ7802870.1 leucyl aminopeptidase [Thiohalophilus sp.]
MNITLKCTPVEQQSSQCLIVGVFEKRQPGPHAQAVDKASDGALQRILKQGDMDGKPGQTLMLHHLSGIQAERVLLVGCGKQSEFDEKQYNKALTAAIQAVNDSGARDAACYLTDLEVKSRSKAWNVRRVAELVHQTLYRYQQTFSKPEKPDYPLGKLQLCVDDKALKSARTGLKIGEAIGKGASFTRDLGNLPGNICTPTYLASQASKQLKDYANMKVKALNQKAIEELKMGAFLSVARGSRQPPKLIVVEYQGTKKDTKPYVLVGKGITFDTGGISIKPAAAMDEMKYDMGGAAGVLGTMQAIGELQPPINVVAIVPSCENMPDGNANKPGDVVTSMSGQTIEILNTDAEGRLILCDALTYSERFKPKTVIDTATLTGACIIALGNQACGLLSNDQPLADALLAAGQTSQDRAWQLPLWDEYQEQLKSNFADMANIGGREAGTITAACFLSRFTKKLKWAHLDIAGTAWKSGAEKGSTGRPVPLLTQYLLDQCGKKYQL